MVGYPNKGRDEWNEDNQYVRRIQTTTKDVPGGVLPTNSGLRYTPKKPQPWLKPKD